MESSQSFVTDKFFVRRKKRKIKIYLRHFLSSLFFNSLEISFFFYRQKFWLRIVYIYIYLEIGRKNIEQFSISSRGYIKSFESRYFSFSLAFNSKRHFNSRSRVEYNSSMFDESRGRRGGGRGREKETTMAIAIIKSFVLRPSRMGAKRGV